MRKHAVAVMDTTDPPAILFWRAYGVWTVFGCYRPAVKAACIANGHWPLGEFAPYTGLHTSLTLKLP